MYFLVCFLILRKLHAVVETRTLMIRSTPPIRPYKASLNVCPSVHKMFFRFQTKFGIWVEVDVFIRVCCICMLFCVCMHMCNLCFGGCFPLQLSPSVLLILSVGSFDL